MSPALIWFIVGFILVLAEFAVPGVILVFIGLGAWVASLAASLGWADTLGSQTGLFAASSLVLLLGLRRAFKGWFLGFSSSAVTAGDLDEFTDKPVRVLQAISAQQQGKVEFKGTPWNARSEQDIAEGEVARILKVDGLCLIVAKP